MKYKLVFGFLLLWPIAITAQKTDREELAPYVKDLKEEVLLHTDRTLYVSGEAVWFSAEYLINGEKPGTPVSKVLYVELFNEKSDAIIQKKYKIQDNSAQGMLEIPGGAPTGNYVLRAYTKYQRNFSHYNYAYSYIVVFNPRVTPDENLRGSEPGITISPEGGRIKQVRRTE